jgi:drug/metabolite transporter (DMT)-like permease
MEEKRTSLIGLHVSNILFAGTGLFSKLIPLPAIDIIALRCLMAAGALLVIITLIKRKVVLAGRRDRLLMVLCGLLMCVHWAAFFHAMQVSTVAVGMIALYTYPIITVFLEPLWQGQRPQRSDLLCGLAMLAGVYLLVPEFSLRSSTALGMFWGAVSAVAFALRNVLQRQYLLNYRGDTSIFYQALIAGLAALPFMHHSPLSLAPSIWLQLGLLAFFCTAVPHSMFAGALRQVKAKTAGLIGCLMPVYGVALAWVVLGEAPGFATILGGLMIVGAAAFESYRA